MKFKILLKVLFLLLILCFCNLKIAKCDDINQFKIEKVKNLEFKKTLSFYGKVFHQDKINIIAPQSGVIKSVDIADESSVNKGDLLFTLGGDLLKNQSEILTKSLKNLEKQLQLAKKLVLIRENAIKHHMVKKESLNNARVQLVSLKNKIKTTQLQIKSIQERMQIHAFTSGIFTKRLVSVGQYVKQGEILGNIVSKKKKILGNVFVTDNTSLVGSAVSIHTNEFRFICGKIIAELPDTQQNGSTQVWVDFKEKEHNLKVGSIVRGKVILSKKIKSLAVPKCAIIQNEKGEKFVFIKELTGYKKVKIKTGLSNKYMFQVISGLKPSDEIVTQGGYELFNKDFNKTFKAAD